MADEREKDCEGANGRDIGPVSSLFVVNEKGTVIGGLEKISMKVWR